jgi:cell division protein FtsN
VAILGAAGYLMMMPQKPPVDELEALQNEKTMPVAPKGTVTTPVGSVPTQLQSAGAAGTAGEPSGTTPAGPTHLEPPPASNPTTTTSSPSGAATDGPAGSQATTVPAVQPPAPDAAPPAPATVTNGWRLQVSSLRDSATAVRVGNDLARRSGLPLEIVADRKATGDVWYAVYLGSFASSEAASATKAQLGASIREFADALVRQPRRR